MIPGNYYEVHYNGTRPAFYAMVLCRSTNNHIATLAWVDSDGHSHSENVDMRHCTWSNITC